MKNLSMEKLLCRIALILSEAHITLPKECIAGKYAHTLANRPSTDWEIIDTHLQKVSSSASAFAESFGAHDWGEVIGRCHDLGKLSDEFQLYLQKPGVVSADAGAEDEEPGKRVDHSTFGARFVAEAFGIPFGQLLAFCIAGHHTGLPDETSDVDATQRSTLRHKLDKNKYSIPEVATPDLSLPKLALPFKLIRDDAPFQLAFFTRMLFSCLVDADRTRSEEFCDPERAKERSGLTEEQSRPPMGALKDQLDASLKEMERKAEPTEVNRQRAIVLDHCRQAADLPPGFFSLNVPTGGGKTLSSLAFALGHAVKKDLQRVVVAIPFTSIIEQTADVYRAALGSFSKTGLIEHHTNLQPQHDTRANQFGTENWDAPLIVTTNVQFFESLFAYRTTPCRKLHNIARSVIILDEAQTIPVELLKPALAALRELVLHYGCSIVLCTATQPALERRDDFTIGIEGVRPIIPDAVPLFHTLRRVEVKSLGKLQDEELSLLLAEQKSALCIVNTRPHASRLYDKAVEKSESDECFHLSTWMCGAHRRAVLKKIRKRLKANLPCRVISTQLVEAGVDLDFPVVYRAEAGFDSIAQAAGRCNREGLLAMGTTYVFEADERPPVGLLRSAADTAKELLPLYPDPLAPEAIEAYFRLFYWMKKESWDKNKVMEKMAFDYARGSALFQFREVAAAFHMIKDDQLPILVPYDEIATTLFNTLMAGHIPFVPQRELQPYLVSINKHAVQKLKDHGFVLEHESGVWLLLNRSLYSANKGLDPASSHLDESLWGV
jgi:CRISPR-associated endonuclease/helicase Cas3